MNRLVPFAVVLAACAPVSHDALVSQSAARVCTAEARCDDVGGDGAMWANAGECQADYTDLFEASWPEDDCQPEDIDVEAWQECLDDAAESACEEGFLDFAAAVSSCRAARVCGA